jgi:hypothetical protein
MAPLLLFPDTVSHFNSELKYLGLMEPSLLLRLHQRHHAPLKVAAWLLAMAMLKMLQQQKEVVADVRLVKPKHKGNRDSDRVVVLVRDDKLLVIYL